MVQNSNVGQLILKMEETLRILRDQDIQQDWNGVDSWKYWEGYKTYKDDWETEQYWEIPKIKGNIREHWARIRCGNLIKEGKKGFRDDKC